MTTTDPYSGTQTNFFLTVPVPVYRNALPGLMVFWLTATTASEVDLRDTGDTDTTHTVLASWYGGHEAAAAPVPLVAQPGTYL